MELQEIDIYIEKDGQVKMEVRGAQGTSCLDLTRDLELALGGEVDSREMKPEAYETNELYQQEQQRQKGW
jgi:hypothetical protein